ncbi:pentatricopeptide repeat-containing protein At1g19720 [Aristolochia californica]|uniref:pentatricopeptide repeat-containing protein At1g19720 n=1 Tax=Aristolochia californica TaxID=171875 RepID=UPI0035E012C5
MECSFIFSKSGHPVHDFFLEEIPTVVASKSLRCTTLFTKTSTPRASKLLLRVVSSKQEKPITLPEKSIKPTEIFREEIQSETPKESGIDRDLHLIELCQNGQLKEAVLALELLAKSGYQVRPGTYTSLLQSCIDLDSIHEGRRVHARISSVRDLNPFVVTKLISMYAKCGSLQEARNVFNEMLQRNLFTWSAMIGGYAREQKWEDISELFLLMVEEGVVPDAFIFPKIVQACANLEEINTGKVLHSFAIRCGLFSYVHVGNSILAMYNKCGELDSALSIFNKMAEKDLVTWNAMISGYCQSGYHHKALKLFERMKVEGTEPGLVTWNILINCYNQSGDCDIALELMKKMTESGITPDVFSWTSIISGFARNNRKSQALDLFREMLLVRIEPNGMTVASAISACASLKALRKGTVIHSVAFKVGGATNVLVGNALIDLYSKCGKLEAAKRVFDSILKRDVFTWNSMIGGYVQAGYIGKAHDLFVKMEDSGVRRNVVTWNVMISGYMQNGDEDQAMELFHGMEQDGIKRSTATWNSLITGSVRYGKENKALSIFRQMQSFSIRPNVVTIISVLPAFTNPVAAPKVKEIHCYVIRNDFISDVPVANSLVDTYAKSGDILKARYVFDCLPFKDLITWNSMLSGYVLHGQPNSVIDLFDRMKKEGVKPNQTTFTALISACGLARMVDKGKEVFLSMTEEYQILPGLEHYTSMVELLGRSGRLKEATDFIEKMPVEPDFDIWAAMLTASRMHSNVSLAINAAENLFKLEPGNGLFYNMLVRMYGLVGRADEALFLTKPKKRNRTANIGFSRIEVNNGEYTFFTGDQSMPNSRAIYDQLDSMEKKIKSVGSDFVSTQVTMEEEEEEANLGTHSEKLAVASALISTPAFQRISITKNLRMCMVCHRSAKLLSLIYGREIIVKDPRCLHHFRNGHCSCGDYW